jgi:hypothetical protein
MILILGNRQGRRTWGACGLDRRVCASLEQCTYNIDITLKGCDEERRPPILVCSVHINRLVRQELDHDLKAVLARS